MELTHIYLHTHVQLYAASHFPNKVTHSLKWKRWKTIFPCKFKPKDTRSSCTKLNKDCHYMMKNDITNVETYAQNIKEHKDLKHTLNDLN